VACSTVKAVEWDAALSKLLDPSGCAVLGVHDAAYEDTEGFRNIENKKNSYDDEQEQAKI
jgi:hypothetical protein